MEQQPFIIFTLNGSRYGINALCIEEIFFLPELTPVTETPKDIAGVLNLRGEIIPIVDLECRLGYPSQKYQINDSVIVLRHENIRTGVIVNQVHEVEMISPLEISHQFSPRRSRPLPPESPPHLTHCLQGLVQVDQDIIMILNPESLSRPIEIINQIHLETPTNDPVLRENPLDQEPVIPNHRPFFCPEASPEDRAIFRLRANNLREILTHEDLKEAKPVAVISLSGEYFGIDLELVREFTPIERITPVPCCPQHIVGNMNLRGEIVTMIDISYLLNLHGNAVPLRAVVVATDDWVAGVVVDEVFDVIYLSKSQIKPIPTATHLVDEAYLRGTANYREKMMGLLDLKKILNQPEIKVNQAV